ncbi:MAG: hypothetical protein ACOC85_03680 [Thermoplasmatota archaeon]
MELQKIGLVISILLILGGVFLISLTESAGSPGAEPSLGISETSEDARIYFWEGTVIIVIGVVIAAVSLLKSS